MTPGTPARIRADLAKIWEVPSPATGRVTGGDPWGERNDVVTFELDADPSSSMRQRLIERGINVAHLEPITETETETQPEPN